MAQDASGGDATSSTETADQAHISGLNKNPAQFVIWDFLSGWVPPDAAQARIFEFVTGRKLSARK